MTAPPGAAMPLRADYSCIGICESVSRQAESLRRRQTQHRPSVDAGAVSSPQTTQGAGRFMRSDSMARLASSISASGTTGVSDGAASGTGVRLRFTIPIYQHDYGPADQVTSDGITGVSARFPLLG